MTAPGSPAESPASSPLPWRRRSFLGAAAAAGAAFATGGAPWVRAQSTSAVLGQGKFRYRVVPGWGELGPSTPVKDCHGIVRDREGHVILLTNHTANNVIVYDRAGRLVHKWGTRFPGAHGLSIVTEGAREVLFITDLNTARVVTTTLDGTVLEEWRWPGHTGKYTEEKQYRPSWTLHLPAGDFFILDGYGRDFICHHGPDGKFRRIFGGQEGGIAHWGPHGGMADARDAARPALLVAMSDQQHLLRLGLDGAKLGRTDLPGGNPRQIRLHDGHFFVAHLADNWPQDRASRGFVSVLDGDLRVLSNVGGTAPEYDDAGGLRRMRSREPVFVHPHDVAVDDDGSLYVAQFASGQTYPLKLERV
jgi:peptidylamidoglycolate lyase